MSKTTITVKITELAGNHVDGFLSQKYGAALESAVLSRIESEYPNADVSVDVDTQMRTSGNTPAPLVAVDGGDEYEISQRVEFLVENESRQFGEQCMQDAEFFE